MASNAPTRKVVAGTAAGSVTVLLAWAAGLAGIEVPPEVSSAVTVLISLAFGWAISDQTKR